MSHIETTVEGHVLAIKVNRPDKLNALSPEMYSDLSLALGRLDREPELRVGLLHAEGKHFSSGVELDRWAPMFARGEGFPCPEGGIDPFALSGPRCSKPVVMAVQGYCYTWGVEIMLNTDVRIAADDTRFALLEVKRGIYPCGGATLRLPEQMGWANAQRYLLTGDAWSAAEALRTGLVQEVVTPGEQLRAARAVAERMAAAAPLGVRAILRSTRQARVDGEAVAAAHVFDDMPAVMASEDAKEGVQSFVERRDAVFKGR
ncbi:crotonase/enoyl-CoA hydratase family protein [Algiphilus sp.]|uniref:crotonase/enoyl-CoA hydratase family protein n=1 Tax=Algiphilus sp. TaxID=1872431 RepID=UPI0025BD9910|nr:crotonase/enoyl-CoA hydratase family protein [Algiphilus sp.]MCK5772130.1 crotonase/enoyl-CoA hydratase family protein [Algiphilus sp.]